MKLKTDLLVGVHCMRVLFVDYLDEFGLVEIHQLGEASGFGGDGSRLAWEEADFAENASDCQVLDVGFGLLLENYDASLDNKEKTLSLFLFNFFVIVDILAINKLLIIINPILLVPLFKN